MQDLDTNRRSFMLAGGLGLAGAAAAAATTTALTPQVAYAQAAGDSQLHVMAGYSAASTSRAVVHPSASARPRER